MATMAPVMDAIEVFEGEGGKLLWLPPITMGYIFTLSGDILDFGLAVAAVGGARFLHDALESEFYERMTVDDGGLLEATRWMGRGVGRFKVWSLNVVTVLYLVAVFWSIWNLYLFFTPTDLVVVTLSGMYWGVLVIILTRIDFEGNEKSA